MNITSNEWKDSIPNREELLPPAEVIRVLDDKISELCAFFWMNFDFCKQAVKIMLRAYLYPPLPILIVVLMLLIYLVFLVIDMFFEYKRSAKLLRTLFISIGLGFLIALAILSSIIGIFFTYISGSALLCMIVLNPDIAPEGTYINLFFCIGMLFCIIFVFYNILKIETGNDKSLPCFIICIISKFCMVFVCLLFVSRTNDIFMSYEISSIVKSNIIMGNTLFAVNNILLITGLILLAFGLKPNNTKKNQIHSNKYVPKKAYTGQPPRN